MSKGAEMATMVDRAQEAPGDQGARRRRGEPDPVSEVAPAPKLRRRPALIAASVATVCLGALLGAWAWSSTSNAQQVVAVRSTVERGETIAREDLMTVRVGVDPALKTIPSEELAGLVGRRATMDLAEGSLLTAAAVAPGQTIPPAGKSIVGVALFASLLPGEPLRSGDMVRVVATPGQEGEFTEGKQVEIEATVVGLHPGADQGKTVVAVEVPKAVAGELAARAATGKVAIVLDSRER